MRSQANANLLVPRPWVLLVVLLILSCSGPVAGTSTKEAAVEAMPAPGGNSGISELIALMESPYRERVSANPGQFVELVRRIVLQVEPTLWVLVDKQTPLSWDFVPSDLVPLNGQSQVPINRQDMSLQREALQSLQTMVRAAQGANVRLDVSSAYRSFEYQRGLFARNVAQLGRAQAERESAVEGTSQHQLGTAVDFGSVTPAFGNTRASEWLRQHASSYGWSLSYPQGMESVTGYMYEPWHYRYVGTVVSSFIDTYFGGIQQHALVFLNRAKDLPFIRDGQ